jgi:hypothetical protein
MELSVEHLKVIEFGKTIAMNEVETSMTAALLDTCCIVKYIYFPVSKHTSNEAK